MDDKIKKLIKYIATQAQSESAFLYPPPDPSFYVFAEPLLDIISELFGIDKTEISQYVNALADSKSIG